MDLPTSSHKLLILVGLAAFALSSVGCSSGPGKDEYNPGGSKPKVIEGDPNMKAPEDRNARPPDKNSAGEG